MSLDKAHSQRRLRQKKKLECKRLLSRLDMRALGTLITTWETTGPTLYVDPTWPSNLDYFNEPLSDFEHLARSVLMLYEWPNSDNEDDFAFTALRLRENTWQPAGPDWEPQPEAEYLNINLDADRYKPIVDARQPALWLLYFLADLKRALAAQDAVRAAGAAFQVAEMRNALVTILELAPLIDEGLSRIRLGRKMGKGNLKLSTNDARARIARAEELRASGKRPAEIARIMAGEGFGTPDAILKALQRSTLT